MHLAGTVTQIDGRIDGRIEASTSRSLVRRTTGAIRETGERHTAMIVWKITAAMSRSAAKMRGSRRMPGRPTPTIVGRIAGRDWAMPGMASGADATRIRIRIHRQITTQTEAGMTPNMADTMPGTTLTCRPRASHNRWPMSFHNSAMLAAAILAALDTYGAAHAQTRVQASTGLQYSSGEYGETTSTSAVVVPFSARVSFGSWSLRASIPYITVDGPADVSEIIDDHGGSSSGSGSSSSGSGSSGSGSGDANDDDNPAGPTFSDDRSTSGLGDASLAATYSFDAIADSPAYVDITGRVRLPTGSEREGLGVGATDYFAVTELGWDANAGGAFVSGGRRILGNVDDVERVDGWQAAAGGWFNVSDAVVLGAYYDWRDSSVRGGEDPSSVEAYITWRMSDSWKIELNAGAGLADTSADYNVGLTLIWRSAAGRH